MIQVKICGLTCEEDARVAVEAGADAIGLDFRPGSPRRVDPPRARAIAVAAGESVERIGVFANEEPARLRSTLSECGLDVAQLHGNEEPGYGQALGANWYRVFRIVADSEPAAMFEDVCRHGGDVFMLDARPEGGGSFADPSIDWRLATKVSMRASLSGGLRMILSGGLNPGNVDEAVRLVRPWRVDVCGGVEFSPGRKDPSRLRDFIAAVRGVDRESRRVT